MLTYHKDFKKCIEFFSMESSHWQLLKEHYSIEETWKPEGNRLENALPK